jgi:hypothetical protein
LNAGSFVRVFDYLDGGIYGKRFFDAGSGCGMAFLTAAFFGAQSATGVDLIENLPVYSRIFIKSLTRLGISPAKANLGFCDLADMDSLQHDPDVSTRANSSEGLTTVSTELFRSPLSLLSNSKTHSAAGNRESKCQGFNDRTFLAGENPCRGCSKRARSPKASSLSKTPERLKNNKPTG